MRRASGQRWAAVSDGTTRKGARREWGGGGFSLKSRLRRKGQGAPNGPNTVCDNLKSHLLIFAREFPEESDQECEWWRRAAPRPGPGMIQRRICATLITFPVRHISRPSIICRWPFQSPLPPLHRSFSPRHTAPNFIPSPSLPDAALGKIKTSTIAVLAPEFAIWNLADVCAGSRFGAVVALTGPGISEVVDKVRKHNENAFLPHNSFKFNSSFSFQFSSAHSSRKTSCPGDFSVFLVLPIFFSP